MKLLSVAALGLLIALAGCSTLRITNEWRDPGWPGPPATHIAVIGISNSDSTRRVFEDTFVQELQTAGVTATASYTQIGPNDTSVNVENLIKSSGADAILVTRVQSVEQRINVSPGAPGRAWGSPWGGPGWGGPGWRGPPGRRGFYGWYGNAWQQAPVVTVTEQVTLETSIWDARTETVVWVVSTQGVASNNVPRMTRNLASTLIPRLRQNGIIH
ncbi:hypothetical protein [Dyella halodurans]|uniref:DUF4136 domain-containing protein n=1 Tax=Dyella halodurans TaxID=1920171 RepID=A0ABV9C2K6_9GAMM|nr:hypothetical protein [Dyella halodurans]